MKNRFLAFTLCMVLLYFALPSTATAVTVSGTPTVSLSVGAVTSENTVDVEISLENNPGIITMILEIGYDADVMTLTNVTDAGILGTAMHTDKLTLNPYQLTWNNGLASSDFTSVGKIATLTFQIADNAKPGTYPITLKCSDTLNYNLDDVIFTASGSQLVIDHVHSLTRISPIAATCVSTGVKEHWHCSGCNKDFGDSTGIMELTDVLIPIDPDNHTGGTEVRNAKEATYTQDGYTGDTYCLGCGTKIAEGSVIPKKVPSDILDLLLMDDVSGAASVRLTAERDCILMVALYTVDGMMIDVELASISGGTGEQVIPVTVSSGGMRLFTARAFLLDSTTYQPLCQKYEACIDWAGG